MYEKWRLHPRLDWGIGLAAAIIWRLGVRRDLVPSLDLGQSERIAVYGTGGSIGTALIGFFIVPVTLALTISSSDQLIAIVRSAGPALRRAVMHAAGAAAWLVVATPVVIAFDHDGGSEMARGGFAAVFVAACFAFVRLFAQIGGILRLREIGAARSQADDLHP